LHATAGLGVVTNKAPGAKLAEKLSDEPEATFCWLPGKMNVDLTVSAKNGSGESQPSAPTSATVPQAVTKFSQRDGPLKTGTGFFMR